MSGSARTPDMQRYCDAVGAMGNSPENVLYWAGFLFDGIDLRGKRFLDVGAGDGRFCFYAACAGAREAVALEPDADGSSDAHNMSTGGFRRMAERMDMAQVRLVAEKLEDYAGDGALFDVVLLHAAVNHLDESLVTRLHEDGAARDGYVHIFERLAELMAPGSTLVVTDAARRNLFGDLGLTNPIARTIEWHKHQQPQLWTQLLGRAGFVEPRIRWAAFNSLRRAGRVLLGNRVAAYLTNSSFTLTMHRDPAPDASSPSPAARSDRTATPAGPGELPGSGSSARRPH